MAKALVKKEESLPQVMPEWMKQYEGEGQDAITRDDLKMPRLKLGQAMSPEVKEQKIAEEGDMFHSITKDIICKAGETVPVVVVAFNKEYILWRDRDTGGGIMARARRVMKDGVVRHAWDKPNQKFEDKLGGKVKVEYNTKQFIDEDGLAEWGSQIQGDPESKPAATGHYNYILYLPTRDELVAISLSRSSAKKAEEFNTLLKMGKVPIYARVYNMGSVPDKAGNNTFANYSFGTKFNIVQDQEQFAKLREMHVAFKDRHLDITEEDAVREEAGNNGKF